MSSLAVSYTHLDVYKRQPEEDEIQMSISPDDVEILKRNAEYWSDKWIGAVAQASAPDGYKEFCELNASEYGELPMMMLPAGHLIAGYPKKMCIRDRY